ncbi:MAG: hypothetical protein ACRD68_02850, partial [Pyrinomonadaceae bacterium]
MLLLFAVTLFLGALALFWVQPLVGKMLLPVLGGTPAVWNTCMLFFQGMLLAGYAYALLSVRWLGARRQAALHLALLVLAALSLPISIAEIDSAAVPVGDPTAWVLWRLLKTVGLPFFVLSAGAPLLQKWFSVTRHPSAGDPYFLYAASNAGSLVALVAFPLLLEPHLRLREQNQLWSIAYFSLIALTLACAAFVWRSRLSGTTESEAVSESEGQTDEPGGENLPAVAAAERSGRLSLRRRLWWAALA